MLLSVRTALAAAALLALLNGCVVIQAPTRLARDTAKARAASGCFSSNRPPDPTGTVCGESTKKKAGRAEWLVAPGEKVSDLHFVHRDYRNAAAFCTNIKEYGRKSYRRYAGWGGVVGILGLAGTSAGATWIATDDKKDQMAGKVAVTAVSAVTAAFAAWMIERSVAAATASGEAGVALGPALDGEGREDARYQSCLETQAKWMGANAGALRAISKAAEAAKGEKASAGGDVVVPNQAEFFAWVQATCVESAAKVEVMSSGKAKRSYRCTGSPPAPVGGAQATKERQYFEKYYRSDAAFAAGVDLTIIVD